MAGLRPMGALTTRMPNGNDYPISMVIDEGGVAYVQITNGSQPTIGVYFDATGT